jgi:hypothetical protein
LRPPSILEDAGPQPFLNQAEDPSVPNAVLEKLNHPFVGKRPKGLYDTLPIISTSLRR